MPISPIDLLCILLVLSGLVFFLGASVGLLRFPDFYTRMHAAGKGDTLSTLLIMAGAGLYELHHFGPEDGGTVGVILIVIKIMAIGVFIMLTSPTSTHALMQAGHEDQIEPAGEAGEVRVQMPALGAPAGRPAAHATLPADPTETTVATAKQSTTRKKVVRAKKKVAATAKKVAAEPVAKKPAAKRTRAKKTAAKKTASGAPAGKRPTAKKTAAAKKSPRKKIGVKKKAPRRKED